MVSDIEYLPAFGKSDHVVISFTLKNQYVKKEEKVHVYNFRKLDVETFMAEMRKVNWNEVFSTRKSLEEAYDDFIAIVNVIIELTVPKYSPKAHKSAPWSNRKIRKLADNKRRKWNAYKNDRQFVSKTKQPET